MKEEASNNSKGLINKLSYGDWEPLLKLIPEIESEANIEKVVSQFFDIVYDIPIIIPFDWPAWDEGRAMASDESFDFDTIDLETKCKLITAVVRNDRFCEGALLSAFKSGFILKILKSIEKEVSILST